MNAGTKDVVAGGSGFDRVATFIVTSRGRSTRGLYVFAMASDDVYRARRGGASHAYAREKDQTDPCLSGDLGGHGCPNGAGRQRGGHDGEPDPQSGDQKGAPVRVGLVGGHLVGDADGRIG